MTDINWCANILMNQGLYALNDQMICDFGENSSEIRRLVTQDSTELLEDLSDSQWNDTQSSNSTPWSNAQWTNQPWSHTAWNNTTPWGNNLWSNNVWNNATPWGDSAWSNAPAWNNFVNSGFN